MIVDPDFLDHWRTQMLADRLQDPAAALYVIRLWAHCQQRRDDQFEMPTAGLKAVCRYTGDADNLESAMVDAGWVERDGDTVTVTGWRDKNKALFANQENGKRGGRPKKLQPQTKTQSKPMANPSLTHGEPMANPSETDKSREDKIRVDTESTPVAKATVPKGTKAIKVADTRFDEWWELYPRKIGKDAARKSYAKALALIVKRGDAEDVLFDGLTRSPRLVNDDPQYVPHAATWLNQGSYDDEPQAPRTAKPSTTAASYQEPTLDFMAIAADRDRKRFGGGSNG